MKKLAIILILNILILDVYSQCSGIKKYAIGESGCSAYFRSQPDAVEASTMEDGSIVYSTSAMCDKITYGIIVIKFAKPMDKTKDQQTETLKQYCEIVKDLLSMKQSVGYGEGHTLEKYPNAIGLIDYCQDESGNECKLKAWIDNNYAAVLYVHFPTSESEKNNFNVQELFLNGFCFEN